MSQEEKFKTVVESFAYYDKTGMQDFLEQKSAEGWRLVRKVFAGDWEFERAEPKKCHYAITYLPQTSNEDAFLSSDNKKEYIEICAASGWQFVCAHKTMVIFMSEEENPLPLETDTEAELDVIHKDFLKHRLPEMIIALVIFVASVAVIVCSDNLLKTYVLSLGGLIVFSFYTILDFCGYLRWRKKALAAAAMGNSVRTDVKDKLIYGAAVAFTLLCGAVIVAELIISGNFEKLERIAFISTFFALKFLFDKLKKKAKSNRKKHILTFVSVLIFVAVIALYGFLSA